MAFYNVFTRTGVSIQSQQGSGGTIAGTDKGAGRGKGFTCSESLVQTSENGQDM